MVPRHVGHNCIDLRLIGDVARERNCRGAYFGRRISHGVGISIN
jgi:hypothetical protein